MAKGKRGYKKRGYKKRGGRRNRGISRMPTNKNNMARVTQLIEIPQLTSGSITLFDNLSLKAADRAIQVARSYQYYRITKVVMRVKPLYDMFGQNLAQGSVPYFYYLIDKGFNLTGTFADSFNSMRDAGARPIRLDEKTITIRWRPCVAVGVGDLQGGTSQTFSMVKVSPWLATNQNSGQSSQPWVANGTDHRGIAFGVEQDILTGGNTQIPYFVSLELFFEFKDPLPVTTATNSVGRVVVDLENLGNFEKVPTVDTTTLEEKP